MTNRNLKIGAVAVAALALAGSAALAARNHQGPRAHITARVDAVLDSVQATPEQRSSITGALDQVWTTIHGNRGERQADMNAMLDLFTADQIDPSKLADVRARHQAEMQKTGDAIAQAITVAHDALTRDQRAAAVAFVRASHKQHAEQAGEHAHGFIAKRVSLLENTISATADQRKVIDQAVAQVQGAIAANHPGAGAHMEQMLNLFAQDKLDPAQIAALRAGHQQRAQAVGDAIAQAITQVHDVLTPAQRLQVAAHVRAFHDRFGGRAG
jgi:hypothetical protein